MKDLITTAGFLFSVMLVTDVNAQNRNAESKDHLIKEVNIEKDESPEDGGNQHDNYEKQDREMMQEDAEEEKKARPSSSIDSTTTIPDAETDNSADGFEKATNDFDNKERKTDTTNNRENESDTERGIGTNSSDSNVNYRTGMPSNVTTPEQLKDK